MTEFDDDYMEIISVINNDDKKMDAFLMVMDKLVKKRMDVILEHRGLIDHLENEIRVLTDAKEIMQEMSSKMQDMAHLSEMK